MIRKSSTFRTGVRRLQAGLLLAAAAMMLFTFTALATEPSETLNKIGQFLDQLKNYIQTLAADEAGEKALLEYMAVNFKSNPDVDAKCAELIKEAGAETAIERYIPIYSGLIEDMEPVDLVTIVKDKLAVDGFTELTEKESTGLITVWFEQKPSLDRKKRYALFIREGWTVKLSDFFSGHKTNRSFCLVKVVKL